MLNAVVTIGVSQGQVAWRCADRVEKGRQSLCKYSPSITDIAIKDLICKELGLTKFDEQMVQEKIAKVLIANDGKLILCVLSRRIYNFIL